jgi:hypothetical protein
MAYLDDHPNPNQSQFRCPRREQPSGVCVVHTAENTPDTIAGDGGAEAVARFISTRDTPGSYHDLCDSDSIINLVRYECEAFHDATSHGNWHEYGVSGATRAAMWSQMTAAWRAGCVGNMAIAASRYAHWLHARRGILVPARRINRFQSESRMPGFISHAERDPARRTDPGRDFPWGDFLALFSDLTADLRGQPIPEPEELPDMFLYGSPGKPVFFCDAGKSVGLNESTDVPTFRDQGVPYFALDDDTFAKFRERFPGA